MVEIFALGRFSRVIGEMVQSKGYRPGNYRLGALLLWCAGEVCGLFAGLALAPDGSFGALLLIYLCALVGAALGAGCAFLFVRGLKAGGPQMV